MSDDQTSTISHLDVKLFSSFVAGLAEARKRMDSSTPDVVINERPSPSIPEIKINDGMEYHNLGAYSGKALGGDFTSDFSLCWNDQILKGLHSDARTKFTGVMAYSDFVATGERDLAIIMPASLMASAEKVFELTGIRHSDTRGPWDDDTYSRNTATISEKKDGSPFEPGEYVVFNFSPTAIDRFKGRFAVGVTKQEEVA